MVNANGFIGRFAALVLAISVLGAAAWLRSAEYDEQYTLFLTAGTPRPDWPQTAFPAGVVTRVQTGDPSLSAIANDLRATDVHPPLYFWALALWRQVFGPGLLAARLMSVLCGAVSIWLVGTIARQCGLRPAVAMLITLGCYGFVYTNAIARGFAPAMALSLGGAALLLAKRPVLGGMCLGAACACNYLAVFVAAAVIGTTCAWMAVPAATPFLLLDGWFFAAQHGARPDQFPPFQVWPTLWRLAEYETASVFGGLPLYVPAAWQVVARAVMGLIAVTAIVSLVRTGVWRPGRGRFMLLAAAIAPAIGLLVLGVLFNNIPVELRYLCFGLPFLGLLAAACVPGRGNRWLSAAILVVQAASIVGLLWAQRTMQPARVTAEAAARLAGNAIVLLPAGNDGVGIVGAFGIGPSPVTDPAGASHRHPTGTSRGS